MKKIILLLILTIGLISCIRERGVYNPGLSDTAEETYIQVGSKILKVNYVVIDNKGSHIYILTPKDTTVKVFIENVGFKDGKINTNVIKVE